MRTSILFIALLFCLSQAFAANHPYEVGDELYVWAPSGLNARMGPSVKAEKIGKWDAGTKLTVLERTNHPFKTTVLANPSAQDPTTRYPDQSDTSFHLSGQWVKVQGPTFVGYVVDVYLIGMKPPNAGMPLLPYLEAWSGAPLQIDTTWLESCEGGPSLDCYEYTGVAGQGIEVRGSAYVVGADHSIVIPGLSLQQGFVLYNYFRPMEDGNRKKLGMEAFSLMRWEKDALYLMENEICELSLSIVNGKLQIDFGCSC